MHAFEVRPYRPSDRAAVRAICCETGNLGDPMDLVFPDRELFADLVMGYYLDYEPSSTFVAESAGTVRGYLTGCLDSRRYRRVMRWRVIPRAAVRGIRRGMLVERATWRLAHALLQTMQSGGWSEPDLINRYPAHLHINLRHEFRGQHAGERLVERFLAYSKAQGVAGVCAAVRGDNLPACRFFARLGFQELSRHPVVWPEASSAYGRHDRVVYAKAC